MVSDRALEPFGESRIERAGDREQAPARAAAQVVVVDPREFVTRTSTARVGQSDESSLFDEPGDGAKDGRGVASGVVLPQPPGHLTQGPGVRCTFPLHEGEEGGCGVGGTGHGAQYIAPRFILQVYCVIRHLPPLAKVTTNARSRVSEGA
jgi:hypothetical protein